MENFHRQYKEQIKTLADQMREESMPPLTEELFALFETTGNRLKYEEVYFRRRKFLAVFGLAAFIFRRSEDIAKLEEILEGICVETCWALPAHVNRWDNPNWQKTVDLFASETAQALAECVALLKNVQEKQVSKLQQQEQRGLSKEICRKVRKEIERRVLQPFEQQRQGWECSDHNWNAVCGGSIGSAAIYLLAGREEERLRLLLERICHSLTFYLKGFREDGACMEGIGYFTYGMTYFTGFAEQLYRYSGGKLDLFANEKVKKIAEFQQKMYFAGGQTVSFSDGEKQAKFRMGLICFLAKKYDTVQVPNTEFAGDFEADPCYRFMGLLRDYLWTKEDDWAVKEPEGSANIRNRKSAREKRKKGLAEINCGQHRHDVLTSAQWSICESKNGIGFAIKGGDNGEPHNHNDVGSFLYLAAGEQLICDLGAGEYTSDYFGVGRYGILCNSSEGHSVPIVNGAFQKAGKEYGASFFEADGKGRTKIEFAGAYGAVSGQEESRKGEISEEQQGEVSLRRLERIAEFSLETGELIITDSFEVEEAAARNRTRTGNIAGIVSEQKTAAVVTEQLVTQGEVELLPESKNSIIIRGKKASCRVLIPGNAEQLRVVEKVHFNHEGEEEKVRLIRWEVPLGQQKVIECGFSVKGV